MKKWIYLGVGIAIGVGASGMPGAQGTMDPVQLSPQYYTVRFENDRIRVLEYRLPPGEKEVMHTHPPRVVYELTDSTVRMSGPNGKPADSPGKAGEVFWGDETTHALQNIGTTEVHAIAVELKTCGR